MAAAHSAMQIIHRAACRDTFDTVRSACITRRKDLSGRITTTRQLGLVRGRRPARISRYRMQALIAATFTPALGRQAGSADQSGFKPVSATRLS